MSDADDPDIGPAPPPGGSESDDVGPAPPAGGGGADGGDVDPALPKAKKRKVCERGGVEAAAVGRANAPARRAADAPPSPCFRLQVLAGAADFVAALPRAAAYHKSYMHRDVVTHAVASAGAGFLVTASADGHVKFWRRTPGGLEFAKHYRAHLGAVAGLVLSPGGRLAASWDADGAVKIFDVAAFDMASMLKLPSPPTAVAFVGAGAGSEGLLAVAGGGGEVAVYDALDESADPLFSFTPTGAPIVAMAYAPTVDAVVACDARGVLDYWRADVGAREGVWPADAVSFALKSESDLFRLAMDKTAARSIAVSPDGARFAAVCGDGRVRVFDFATGRLKAAYDESPAAASALQRDGGDAVRLDAVDFGRRLAVDRERAGDPGAPPPNAVFDESGHFLILGSLLGVKVINLVTHRLARLLGKGESGERFLRVALFQAPPRAAAARGRAAAAAAGDPLLIATAYGKHRFYVFGNEEPEGDDGAGRDVLNEKPRPEDLLLAAGGGDAGAADALPFLPKCAVLRTTAGDVTLRLFPAECPLAVENFTKHAASGYYDGTLFHRVIKGFMIQGGDPLGDGTGGASVWGAPFADEIVASLRHDRPFTLSMANAGPGTNGSQFFVTTVPTPWLDGKHTVFGRVVKGADVVQAIERAKTGKSDRPLEDISIVSIDVRDDVGG
jgi:peptidylprolyl isomerase domain and WD repeat-containing protein 1